MAEDDFILFILGGELLVVPTPDVLDAILRWPPLMLLKVAPPPGAVLTCFFVATTTTKDSSCILPIKSNIEAAALYVENTLGCSSGPNVCLWFLMNVDQPKKTSLSNFSIGVGEGENGRMGLTKLCLMSGGS